MGRSENIEIFEDTQRLYRTDQYLLENIKISTEEEEFYPEKESIVIEPSIQYKNDASIILSSKRTLGAASNYAYKKKRVCILNFASATNPGGGVIKGSSAQEESICRISTLFPSLSSRRMMKNFYFPHRNEPNPLHNDDIIYTPGVVVFKSDTRTARLLDRDKWFKVDVVTCAAPNLRINPSNEMNMGDGSKRAKISDKELLSLLERRIHRILEVAAAHKNEVLILGAFGCGAFSNPPSVVATAMKREIENYRKFFETIEIAVYCPPYDNTNYEVFCRVFGNVKSF